MNQVRVSQGRDIGLMMKKEQRFGNNRRSGEDRRKGDDPNYAGVERRSGKDRRYWSDRREFIFVIRRPDGQEYNMSVFARKEADAVLRLNNLFNAICSMDRIVSLKASEPEE
jgi:hypothetical protein